MGKFHHAAAGLALLLAGTAPATVRAETGPRLAQAQVHVPTEAELERMEREARTTPPLSDRSSPDQNLGTDVWQRGERDREERRPSGRGADR